MHGLGWTMQHAEAVEAQQTLPCLTLTWYSTRWRGTSYAICSGYLQGLGRSACGVISFLNP